MLAISEFAALVYLATAQIPKGCVSTYGAIAQAIGRPQANRAVGQVLHRNPFSPAVPCHRVVGQNGRLIGFAQGLKTQKDLLNKEGIAISSQGKIINFNMVFYQPKLCLSTINKLSKNYTS